jgi:hypothetical protein
VVAIERSLLALASFPFLPSVWSWGHGGRGAHTEKPDSKLAQKQTDNTGRRRDGEGEGDLGLGLLARTGARANESDKSWASESGRTGAR